MIRKLLVILGTVAAFMATFTVSASACTVMYGETQVPDTLQKDL